ncbi:DUF481 domain-containing protein [Bremerella sp. T1]|uniref:DUF481 domain-containing protein n=1 Tax=Bremerella sp. TYQ1 TaxID=3119568 RepID=UPI001CCC47A4|nr:DUF481 domain-containing protein [Bremerella volcania]UBM35583.1 DUF481 domain-containing protein [Bremerella volcania]
MGSFSPTSIFGIVLLVVLSLASYGSAEEKQSFDGVGHSYFEQTSGPASDAEFVHYMTPEGDVQSTLTTVLELPPLPDLPEPPPEPPAKEEPAPAEEVEKPKEAEKEEPEEEADEYGYFEYIPYGQYGHIDYWFGPAVWSNSAELGLNGQTGNTESNSLRVGAKIKRSGEHTIFSSQLRHLRTADKDGLTQNNAYFNHKLEWPLKLHENWSLFETTNLEYDEFKAFDMRLVFNGGVSYKPYKTDQTEWTLSAGSGFSQEFGSPQKGIVPEATLGTEFKHQVTEAQKLEFNYEFFPAFEANEGYRFVADASYVIALRDGLSLKLSAVDRYDSTPNDRKRNDLDYACLLLWEF